MVLSLDGGAAARLAATISRPPRLSPRWQPPFCMRCRYSSVWPRNLYTIIHGVMAPAYNCTAVLKRLAPSWHPCGGSEAAFCRDHYLSATALPPHLRPQSGRGRPDARPRAQFTGEPYTDGLQSECAKAKGRLRRHECSTSADSSAPRVAPPAASHVSTAIAASTRASSAKRRRAAAAAGARAQFVETLISGSEIAGLWATLRRDGYLVRSTESCNAQLSPVSYPIGAAEVHERAECVAGKTFGCTRLGTSMWVMPPCGGRFLCGTRRSRTVDCPAEAAMGAGKAKLETYLLEGVFKRAQICDCGVGGPMEAAANLPLSRAADASVDEAAGASGRHLAKDYLRYYGVRQIYTISLPRRADRRAFMRRRAAAIHVPHAFLDAFDCQRNGRDATPPGVGLLQGHLCVHYSWQSALLRAIDEQRFPCLITEDDVDLVDLPHPCSSLHGPPPAEAAVVALHHRELDLAAHPECRAPRLPAASHAHTTLTPLPKGWSFAALLFPSEQGAREVLAHLMCLNPWERRPLRKCGAYLANNLSLPGVPTMNVDTHVFQFWQPGASSVVCPPLLRVAGLGSDTTNSNAVAEVPLANFTTACSEEGPGSRSSSLSSPSEIGESTRRRRQPRSAVPGDASSPAAEGAGDVAADSPSGCAQPLVAVCIVGQLRSAARLEVVSGLRQVWDGVGAGCADIYLNLGAEPVDAAHHHAEEAAPSEEALAQAIRVLRPVDSIISRHPLPEGSEAACARPTDFNSSSVLCEVPPFGRESAAGWPSCFADLGGRQCTHCAASRYRLAASRIAQCGPMIQRAIDLGKPYRHLVLHRPDVALAGIPPLAAWERTLARVAREEGVVRAARKPTPIPPEAADDGSKLCFSQDCGDDAVRSLPLAEDLETERRAEYERVAGGGEQGGTASPMDLVVRRDDIFFVGSIRLLPVFANGSALFGRCQSKALNLQACMFQPRCSWHWPECIWDRAFLDQRVRAVMVRRAWRSARIGIVRSVRTDQARGAGGLPMGRHRRARC